MPDLLYECESSDAGPDEVGQPQLDLEERLRSKQIRAMILSASNRQLSILHFHMVSNFLESANAHRENIPPCAAQ